MSTQETTTTPANGLPQQMTPDAETQAATEAGAANKPFDANTTRAVSDMKEAQTVPSAPAAGVVIGKSGAPISIADIHKKPGETVTSLGAGVAKTVSLEERVAAVTAANKGSMPPGVVAVSPPKMGVSAAQGGEVETSTGVGSLPNTNDAPIQYPSAPQFANRVAATASTQRVAKAPAPALAVGECMYALASFTTILPNGQTLRLERGEEFTDPGLIMWLHQKGLPIAKREKGKEG